MIPLFGHYLKTLSFLCIITVILFVPVFAGIRGWIKYKFFWQALITVTGRMIV
jgi:hypothetical protein